VRGYQPADGPSTVDDCGGGGLRAIGSYKKGRSGGETPRLVTMGQAAARNTALMLSASGTCPPGFPRYGQASSPDRPAGRGDSPVSHASPRPRPIPETEHRPAAPWVERVCLRLPAPEVGRVGAVDAVVVAPGCAPGGQLCVGQSLTPRCDGCGHGVVVASAPGSASCNPPDARSRGLLRTRWTRLRRWHGFGMALRRSGRLRGSLPACPWLWGGGRHARSRQCRRCWR
jgi:hypothetical protein